MYIPSVSNSGKSYNTRYLLFRLDVMKKKKEEGTLSESDFRTIPSYEGFREKVKDLLGFGSGYTSGK